MKVGIQLPEVEYEIAFPDLIAMAQLAEQVGFDSIWLGDHLLYDVPVGPRGPWEVWTALAALAASTERVELGPLVASTSFHAPPMLAKMASTVDAISNGRLVLGVGAGWNLREYTAFGFPYDHRVSRFEEAFTIVRTLLAEGSIDFHGTYYELEDSVLHPRSPRPGRTATAGRIDRTPDAGDHAAARVGLERVVERLRQHRRRIRRRQGHGRRADRSDRTHRRDRGDGRRVRQAARRLGAPDGRLPARTAGHR